MPFYPINVFCMLLGLLGLLGDNWVVGISRGPQCFRKKHGCPKDTLWTECNKINRNVKK